MMLSENDMTHALLKKGAQKRTKSSAGYKQEAFGRRRRSCSHRQQRTEDYGEGEWKVRKFGYSKRRTWRKNTFGVDENSGQILAQVLTDNKTDDASILPKIVDQVLDNGVDVDKVGADGAYDIWANWDFLEELEIQCIIPPRENAAYQFDQEDNPRNQALAIIDEGGVEANRKGWKEHSGYHRRSISETTFFRWKTTFGDKMYARIVHNQITEAAIKSAILNRFIQIAKPVSVKVA